VEREADEANHQPAPPDGSQAAEGHLHRHDELHAVGGESVGDQPQDEKCDAEQDPDHDEVEQVREGSVELLELHTDRLVVVGGDHHRQGHIDQRHAVVPRAMEPQRGDGAGEDQE
jgi:hypothetical protein